MNEVIVYSSSGCPYCEKVKRLLQTFEITFEDRNVTLHKQYFEELKSNKLAGTPATFINGKLVLGFQEKKFQKALNLDEAEMKLFLTKDKS
ncbi:MAG: thioredoxin family protein [Bacillaceae bacterium]|nr:thioredoxin family protein [Bacillaceae bacterium]